MVGAAGLSLSQLVKLGKAGLRTVEDVAGLTPDELRFVMMEVESEVKLDDLFDMPDHEIGRLVRQSPLSADEANAIIMAARVQIYGDDVLTPEPAPVEGEEEAEGKAAEPPASPAPFAGLRERAREGAGAREEARRAARREAARTD